MASIPRKLTTGSFVALLALGGAACSDEDGDGARTDEEIGELEDKGNEVGDEVENEIDEGREEIEE